MKVYLLPVLILPFCLFSCKSNKDKVILFDLVRADYTEKVYIPGTVQAVSSIPVIAPRSSYGAMTVERIAEDGSYVRKGDTLCILSVPQIVSAYRDMLSSIEVLEAELKKAEADNKLTISKFESELESGKARLKIATLDTLKLKYAVKYQQDLFRLEMKKALIEKEKIEKKVISTRKIAQNDIRQKQFRITQQKMRAQAMADQIKAMTIIAQRDGIVIRTESPRMSLMSTSGTGTFGGPVREGTVLMFDFNVLQFPDMSRLQISADATESDFKRIEKGQKAIIYIDAAGKLITSGKVIRKSLASTTAQRYSGSKVRAYEVVIDIDSCYSKMKPGLSAKCEIILKEVRDTLFVPSMSVFEKDSSKVVYVKKKKSFTPVQVETGIEGDSYTLITSGLKGGEKIALTEPPENLIIHDKSTKKKSGNDYK